MELELSPNEGSPVTAKPEISNLKNPTPQKSCYKVSTLSPRFRVWKFVPQQTVVASPASPRAKGERQLPALLL